MGRETSVGISEFVRSGNKILALFKARYSDFQVSEISKDGRLAELTDILPPTKPPEPPTTLEKLSIQSGLPKDQWDLIIDLDKSEGDRQIKLDVTHMDKEHRKDVHVCIKKAFKGRIITSTISEQDKRLLQLCKRGFGNKTDVRKQWPWPKDHVHFVLYKENRGTMDVAATIADKLRFKKVDPAYFGYCGTKDKRAKTSQWFSIKRTEPSKIVDACKGIRDIAVGNFTFGDERLKLGDLKGNRFKIALRNIPAEQEQLKSSLEDLKTLGFINYYGLQRFGNQPEVPTHLVGQNILKGDYSKATELILTPCGKMHDALSLYKLTGDAKEALAKLRGPRQAPEMKLLRALAARKGDGQNSYMNAINAIPRNMKLLYIHSYQSLIWNKCVSERLRRFGHKCHPGDMISAGSLKEDFLEDVGEEIDEDNFQESVQDKEQLRVSFLTQEDVESEKYSIFDVIMPLPGYEIQYPTNMVDYYEELLKNDGLGLGLRHKNKMFSLAGAYRKILAKPENLSWEFVRYSRPIDDLIESDLDKLQGKNIVYDTNGEHRALVLNFDLPSSCYATMALRELLKMNTSIENQKEIVDRNKIEAENLDLKRKLEDESELIVKKNKIAN